MMQTIDASREIPSHKQRVRAPDAPRAVLIADDNAAVARSVGRMLHERDYDVTVVGDGVAAIAAIMRRPFDAVLCDIHMPGMSGVEVLEVIRAYDLDLPVILMTGAPNLETAMEAVSLGAVDYLLKPASTELVFRALDRAIERHRVSRADRVANDTAIDAAPISEDLARLNARFDSAMHAMWIAYQPIMDTIGGRVFGYEALLRTEDKSFAGPLEVIRVAERLGRLEELGQRVRAQTVVSFANAPKDASLFVNLHPRDLLDPDLFREDAPLVKMADRVVLEVTERAGLDDVKDVRARISILRYLGFRVAIDDLGAGYAGLSSIAQLEPDFVKLDMSLIRNLEKSVLQQRLVGTMTTLCRDLGVRVVAEGIETSEEHDCLHRVGCDLMQGYLFGTPGPLCPPTDV
jgi:EAL domain-containing protein (putative c-di-GMP-specific phosphodiesterase class I)